jgi:hypothetical protein
MNKKINNINDLLPVISKLGFTIVTDKKFKDKSIIKYRITSKEEYISLSLIKNNDGSENVYISFMYEEYDSIHKKGFFDVYEILKKHFIQVFRKEAITKLLS